MTEFIMKYWIQAIFAAAIGVMGGALKRMKKQYEKAKADNEAMRCGMKALLRAEIISTYNHYKSAKVLPIYARENLYGLYKEYEALGGNGAIKDLMEIASEWPLQ
ncbi:hypothetical protein [Fusibacter bizertensis]